MVLVVSPAVLADMPVLTDIYMVSFKDKIANTCFPRTTGVRAWWEANNVEAFTTEPSTHFIKVTDGDEIIAYAKWIVPLPNGETGGDDPDAMPLWPEDADSSLCESFFGALARERQRIMGTRPHYCKTFNSDSS